MQDNNKHLNLTLKQWKSMHLPIVVVVFLLAYISLNHQHLNALKYIYPSFLSFTFT